MYDLIYLALKNRLLDGNPLGLKLVDWYQDQLRNANNGTVAHSPALYIQFMPVVWRSATDRTQQAILEFRTYLVQDDLRTKRSDDPNLVSNVAHLQLINDLYKLLQGWGYRYTSGSQTYQLLNSISRTSSEVDHTPANKFVSVTSWKCFIIDYSANRTYIRKNVAGEILAELCIPFQTDESLGFDYLLPVIFP